MKVHVVFDRDGAIVGAARLDAAAPVRARPLADEQAGHRAAVVYVPAAYHHYDLAAVCQRLRVTIESTYPELTAKE